MLSLQLLIYVTFCVTLSYAFSSHISFDENLKWPNQTFGYSQEKLLKWTYNGRCQTSDPIIPGINGTSLLIETSKPCQCNQLVVEPLKNIATNSLFYVSFWIFIQDWAIKVDSASLMIASGKSWSNPIWSWLYFLESSNFQAANFKIKLVNTLTMTRIVTHVYPIATFRLRSWNFVTISMDQVENIYLYINKEKLSSLRQFESDTEFHSEPAMELSIRFGSIANSFNDCPTVILDDILISDNNDDFGNLQRNDRMYYCPHDIQSKSNHLKCICWEGYSLKTTNNDGICRDSVTCCVDVDECAQNRNICPFPTKCSNKVGSYDCKIHNGICTKMPHGNWICECHTGYTGDYCKIAQKITQQDTRLKKQYITEKLPKFKLALPKRPFTKDKLTFFAYTHQDMKSFQRVMFVWNMGDGTALINNTKLQIFPHGLVEFYKTLDINLAANDCNTAYGVMMAHSYELPSLFHGSLTIYNSYVVSQRIPFQIRLSQKEKFCQPKLHLTNIFSKHNQIAIIDLRKTNLITSFIELPGECSLIKSVDYTWKSNSAILNTQFQSRIYSHKNYIRIPKWSLPIGQLEIYLEAQIKTTDNKMLLTNCTGLFDVKSPILPRRIYGGITRSHPAEIDAIIKVSTYGGNFLNSNLTYKWSCWTEDGQPLSFCSQHDTNNNTELKIPGKYLQNGMVYKVKVTTMDSIEKEIGHHIQELRIRDKKFRSAYIECIENCFHKSSPMINIILKVRPPHRKVGWSFAINGAFVHFNWKKQSCPTRYTNMLCLKPLAFPSGIVIDIKATLYDQLWKVEGEATYQIHMTEAIIPGKCFVKPEEGVTILTKFDVGCSGFDDGKLDLAYELYQRNIFTQQRILIQTSTIAKFDSLTLSAGDERNRYRSELVIIATNVDQAQTRVSVNVTVFPVSQRFGSRVVPTFLHLFMHDGAIEQLELSGNLIGAVQLASAVANSLEVESLKNSQEKAIKSFSEIRQSLTENLKHHLPYDLYTVQQSATVLEQILNTSIKQLKTKTQASQTAMDLAESLTSILRKESRNEHLDTTHRMNSTKSILRAVSDLLLARSTSVKPVLNLTQAGPFDYEDRDYFENSDDDIIAQKSTSKLQKSLEVDLASRSFKIIRKLDKIVQGDHNLRLETTIKGNKMRATIYSNIHKISTKNDDVYGTIKYDPISDRKFKTANLSLGIDKLDFNPLPHQSLSNTINTPFVRVSLRNSSMDKVETASHNLSVDLFLHRPKIQPTVKETVTYKLTQPKEIYVHKIDIPNVIGFAIIRVEPEDESIEIKVIVTYDHRPSMIDLSNNSYELPRNNQSTDSDSDDKYTVIVPVTNEIIAQEVLYLGVYPGNILSSFQYELSISFANCYYWDEENNAWSTQGCTVGLRSQGDYLHCKCSHMSLFSGGIFVCPNHIHPFLDIYLFLTIEDNPIMVIVLACLFFIYLLLLPIAMRFDRKYAKREIAVLEDNEPDQKYFYFVIVSTGYQRGSGTTAHVALKLKGDRGNSRTFVLGHPTQPILQQGSIDTFLLTANTSVGQINEILIFHDFSGTQPHWYLRSIIVYDCQLNQQWRFSVFRWLTINNAMDNGQFIFKNDQSVSRPKATFWELTSEKFCDEHLLYSIFNKPSLSRFTCVQRLSCFLCIRLMTMLASLMFYGIPRNDKSAQIEVGEFYFSLRQLIIGIESSLVVIPVSFILAFLFRNSRLKDHPKLVDLGPRHRMENNQNVISNEQMAKVIIYFDDVKYGSTSQNATQKFTLRNIFKQPFELPYQCRYLAWTLVVLCCSISSYMIILYGLRYGKVNSLNWLVSSLTAFSEGVLLQQPFLIIIEIIAVMFIFRFSEKSPMKSSIEIARIPMMERWRTAYFKFYKKSFYFPLPKEKLPKVQHQTTVKKKTSKRVIEIVGFCFFFLSLWTLVIQVKHPSAYYFTRYIKQNFIRNYRLDVGDDHKIKLDQVSSIELIYKYIKGTIIRGIHTQQWKLNPADNKSTATNSVIQLLGVARVRQLRVKPDACLATLILTETKNCAPDYNGWNSNHADYLPFWSPWKNDGNASQNASTPWQFTTGDYFLSNTIYGYLASYSDYGYVADLGKTVNNSRQVIKYLEEHNWIDNFTRVVFCEFTLYNVNLNFFSHLTTIFEISSTGKIIPDYRIWTFRPFGYFQNFTPTLIAAIVIVTSLFIFYLAWEIVQMVQLKRDYFKVLWNYVDLSILICCLLLLIFYGIYFNAVSRCVQKLHEAKRNVFVSFNPAIIWDTISTSTFGVIVGLNMLKIWKLLTFNKRMYSFILTIRKATVPVFNFSIMYIILLIAFAHATFLILGPYKAVFHSFGKNLLHYVLFSFGKNSFEPYSDYNSVMGVVIFVVFTVVVYYYFMRMLEAIMVQCFKKTRAEIKEMKSNYEMVQYIKEKFNIGVDSETVKRNEKWLEIEQKLNEVNNACQLIIRKNNR